MRPTLNQRQKCWAPLQHNSSRERPDTWWEVAYIIPFNSRKGINSYWLKLTCSPCMDFPFFSPASQPVPRSQNSQNLYSTKMGYNSPSDQETHLLEVSWQGTMNMGSWLYDILVTSSVGSPTRCNYPEPTKRIEQWNSFWKYNWGANLEITPCVDIALSFKVWHVS